MTILIGIPMGLDCVANAQTISTVEGWRRYGGIELFYAPTPFVSLGRDSIVQQAEKTKASHILFLDADVVPLDNILKTLLESDKDIVTGVCPIVDKGLRWNVSLKEPFEGIPIKELPDEMFKVNLCGFAVVLVKREVFEKLEWPYWQDVVAGGRVTKGEDVYFCEKAATAGYDIWCNPKAVCDHVRIINLLSAVQETENVYG